MVVTDRPSTQPEVAIVVAHGASHIFLLSICTNLITVGAFAVVARVVSTSQMGVIGILMLLNGVCRLTVALGTPRAVTRFVAEHFAKEEVAEASAVFRQALKIALTLSIVLAAVIFLTARSISVGFLGDESHTALFQIFSVDILAGGLISILNGTLLGLQKTRELSLINVGYLSIRAILTAIFVLAIDPLRGLISAWILSDLAATIALFIFASSRLGFPEYPFQTGRLIRFSFPLFAQEVVEFANAWVDRAMLYSYTSLSIAGTYLAATTAFGVAANLPGAISTVLLPSYSTLYRNRGREALQDAMRGASRYACLAATPLVFGLLAAARPALTLFVGESYAEGSVPLMILCFFYGITLASISLGVVPVVLGRTMLSLKLAASNVVIGGVLALILMPSLQAVGAAVAKGSAMIGGFLLMVILVGREVKVSIDYEALTKSILASTVMAVVVLLAQLLFYSRFLLPLYVSLGGATYLAALRCLRAIRSSDMELVRKFVGRRLEFMIGPLEKFVVSRAV